MKRLILFPLCAALLGISQIAGAENIKNRTFIDSSFDGVKVIRVSQSVLNVSLTQGTSDRTDVKCFVEDMTVKPDGYRIKARQTGSTLEIYQEFAREINNSIVNKKGGYIRISAPAGVKVISVGTSSGNVSVSGFSLDTLKIAAISGDVRAENFSARILSQKTSSGDVDLVNGRGEKADVASISGDIRAMGAGFPQLSARTSSGDVTVSGIPSAQQVSVNSISGDVSVSGVKASGSLSVRTSSGELSVKDCAGGQKTEMSSISGDIRVSGTSGKVFSVGTSSGDISMQNIQGEQLEMSGISGDKNVRTADFEKATMSGSSGVQTVYFGPAIKEISFRTISGNVNLYLKGNLKNNRYSFTGVSSNIEVAGLAKAERSLELDPQNAAVSIRGKASSGNISVKNY